MKPVVVKIGGGTLENPSIVEDLVKLQKEGGAPGGDPRGRIGGHPVAICYPIQAYGSHSSMV